MMMGVMSFLLIILLDVKKVDDLSYSTRIVLL